MDQGKSTVDGTTVKSTKTENNSDPDSDSDNEEPMASTSSQTIQEVHYMNKKIGGTEGTKPDDDFVEMEKRTDITYELVSELQLKTKEYLQPNPTVRAKMEAVKGISKLSDQAKTSTYPQPEGVLGECMTIYGQKLGEDSMFAQALLETGESMKQMADIKYSLDDNVKQSFLEPLHHLQTIDLMEVMHLRNKLQGFWLDFGSHTSDEEIKLAEDKFGGSLHLAQMGMHNVLENDVERVTHLSTFANCLYDYHRQCAEILKTLTETLDEKKREAASRPKKEFTPKTLHELQQQDLNTGDGVNHSIDTLNGGPPNSDSDNDESTAGTSYQITQDVTSSRVDSSQELLEENPFLLPNVLECLVANSTSHELFNYRLVGQHIWNGMAVNEINRERSVDVRLVKIFDPSWKDVRETRFSFARINKLIPTININELISTLRAGRLQKSTLTRIYINSSVAPFDLNQFLQLNGQIIRTLHYDGDSLKDLRQILQTCAKNLTSLSLWRSCVENEDHSSALFNNENDEEHATLKFPHLERIFITSGEIQPQLDWIDDIHHNDYCNPSKEFLSHIFQASTNLKSLSVRFYDSFILDSGLSFKMLTTLCIKFKIRNTQLRALCGVGLRLKNLRLHKLFATIQDGANENENIYSNDPEWMEFRRVLLDFIRTQANTLECFTVSLFTNLPDRCRHNSPQEHWSSMSGFPRMPNLHTFMLNECSAQIPTQEYSLLFPKLKNLEIVGCRHRTGPPQAIIAEFHQQIEISPNPSILVQNIRGIKPTMELAQVFPEVIEFHIENQIPYDLPIYWPKLKHLYYKESCHYHDEDEVLAYVREINKFLVGISPEESERIERKRLHHEYETKLELPRSRPSIFDLTELETLEFGFSYYEFEEGILSPGVRTALEVLITLGLSRLTHLKKLNFVLEQKPKPSHYRRLPYLNGLVGTFRNRKDFSTSTNCNVHGEDTMVPVTKKWTLQFNLDHHKSEWKEIDGLFHDDPDICSKLTGPLVWDDSEDDE